MNRSLRNKASRSVSALRGDAYFPIFIAVAIASRVATETSASASFVLLALWALMGRKQAVQALALSWLFTILSSGIVPQASLGSVGRYAVTLSATLSIFLRSGILLGRLHVSPMVASICSLGVLFIFHSVFISPMPDVSVLKAVSWTLVLATLMSAWQGLTPEERDGLVNQLFGGLVIILLLSLPLLLLPLGYLRNGSGFQGILNHPQVFGPTMALLGAWAGSQLFAQKRPSWPAISLVGAALVLVVLSEARTAGLAMVLGIVLAVVSAPVLSGEPMRVVMPGLRSKRVWGVLGVALFVGVGFAPRLSGMVENFITKSGRAGEVQSVLEAYERSRGGLIDEMWANVKEHPFTGIGFGIGSNPLEMQIERDPVFGLPFSASIEKGVLPIAILEELGIMAFVVALWFWTLVRRAARGGVTPLAVTTTALLLNMGENTFFSPGGMGLLSLVLVCWAATASGRPVTRSTGQTLTATSLNSLVR